MKKWLLTAALLFCIQLVFAQKYVSRDGKISFFSDAPMEDIEAVSQEGMSAVNLTTGEIVFSIPIRSFTFKKSLMQEHFNENYMESEKYPKSIFKGKVSGYNAEEGKQQVWAEGQLTIHGVSRQVKVPGEMKVDGDKLQIKADFTAALKDYDIEIPKVMFYKIAEEIEITLAFDYQKHEQ